MIKTISNTKLKCGTYDPKEDWKQKQEKVKKEMKNKKVEGRRMGWRESKRQKHGDQGTFGVY